MAAASRTVRRLRLRAPNEAAVRRMARVLEDALRTATLPDAGGRILFVRRLALGHLAADAQPMSVALALEEAVGRARVEWLHGDEPGAGDSGAVWFRDPLEAHVALARQLLAGHRPEAWYWPLAVPAWNRGLARGEAVRAIAHSLAARAEAPAALPRWFAELVEAGYASVLVAALRAEDVEVLARAAGVRVDVSVAAEPRGVRGESDEAPLAGPAVDAARRLMEEMLRTERGDGAGGPLSTLHLRHARAPAASISTPPRGARVRVGRPFVVADAGGEDGSPCVPDLPAEPRLPEEGGRQGGASLTLAAEGGLVEGGRREARVEQEVSGVASLTPVSGGGLSRHWLPPTGAGGLLFLLRALDCAGYAEWLAAQPAWAPHQVARRVLGRILARLAIGQDDPIWNAVRVHSLRTAPPRRFIAPARWRDGLLAGHGSLLHAIGACDGRLHDPSGRLLLAAWRGPCPRSLLRDRRAAAPSHSPGPADDLVDDVVVAWETAVRRWLRRFATLGLRDLTLRRAALAVTPTHIDVHFNLGAVDPRIRRAGLDLDPGWIPWFGRVVAFHYEPGGPS